MYWCLCPGLCYVHMLWLTCLLLLCRYCNSLQYLCLTEAGTRYFSIKTVQKTVQTEAKPHIRWPHIREYEAGESGANFTSFFGLP